MMNTDMIKIAAMSKALKRILFGGAIAGGLGAAGAAYAGSRKESPQYTGGEIYPGLGFEDSWEAFKFDAKLKMEEHAANKAEAEALNSMGESSLGDDYSSMEPIPWYRRRF